MRLNIEFPDELGEKLLLCAKMDGHKNRAAVVRKILQIFFDKKLAFSCFYKTKNIADQKTPKA